VPIHKSLLGKNYVFNTKICIFFLRDQLEDPELLAEEIKELRGDVQVVRRTSNSDN